MLTIDLVMSLEAENFAQVLGGRYFEMSADENVQKGDYTPFQHLAREIRRLNPLSESVS